MSRATPGFDSIVATGKGDSGTTGLLFGGDRIRKDDLRTEAYGTIDEAVAALGVARASCLDAARDAQDAARDAQDAARDAQDAARDATLEVPTTPGSLAELILAIQRDLFVAAAELATNPDAWERQEEGRTRVSAAMVGRVDGWLRDLEGAIEMPREFVVPGENHASAALELARTILRRAERRAVTLEAAGLVPGAHLLPYLNRTADLLWVLARAAEQADRRHATPARSARTPRGAIDKETPEP